MNMHTHHFGVNQNTDIPRFRTQLSQTCVRFIDWQEKRLEAKCTKVWWQRNPLGEVFLFGKFVHSRTEWTPVTLAHYHPNVGFITPNRDIIDLHLASDPTPNRI